MTTTSINALPTRPQVGPSVTIGGFKFSSQMVRLMDNIVEANIEYCTDRHSYFMDYSDLDDFHKEQLMAQLMADSLDIASEATGADNQNYPKMLETLIEMLRDSTNKEKVYEFVTAWREGIANYSCYLLPELLQNRVEEYNFEYANDAWRELAD